MRLFNVFSLRQWLTLPYIALVFGVALLIGTLSYRTGSQAVDTIANHLLLETVARIGQAVDRHVVGSAAVLEAAFPNGMPGPDSIDDDLPALRTRFWIATRFIWTRTITFITGISAGSFRIVAIQHQ